MRPTSFDDLVIPPPEAKRLREEKREEMEAHAEHAEDHESRDCPICKQIAAEKELQAQQERVEASLAARKRGKADDAEDAAGEAEPQSLAAAIEAKALPVRRVQDLTEEGGGEWKPDATVQMAVIVDDETGSVFLPDTFMRAQARKAARVQPAPPEPEGDPRPARLGGESPGKSALQLRGGLQFVFVRPDAAMPARSGRSTDPVESLLPVGVPALLREIDASKRD